MFLTILVILGIVTGIVVLGVWYYRRRHTFEMIAPAQEVELSDMDLLDSLDGEDSPYTTPEPSEKTIESEKTLV